MTLLYYLAIIAGSAFLIGLTFLVCCYTIFIAFKIREDQKLAKSKSLVLRYKQKAILHRLRGEIQEEKIDYKARKENEQNYIQLFNVNPNQE